MCRRTGVLVSDCFVFFLFILVCLSLFQQHAAQYHLHWSQHNVVGSLRRLCQIFLRLCASVMCSGAALDMIKIPEYVSTLQAEGTFDRWYAADASRGIGATMCPWTFVSWSLPRVSLSLSSAVFCHAVGKRARVHVRSCSLRAATKGVHTAHALSVCSFFRSWPAYEIVQIRPC